MRQELGIDAPAKPFVKWAGGKRQLLPTLHMVLPAAFGAYHEPFVGGGAMLFSVMGSRPTRSCHASDLNSDLMLTYLAVRDQVRDLVESLRNHAANFKEDPKRYYYMVRSQSPRGRVEKASRLIFLNKTCFNGLYRVNSQGRFNVPLGSYSNPNIVGEENLMAASAMLESSGATFECRDFESVQDRAKPGDLVYFDPPYHPISRAGNFTGYTDRDFTYDDLSRLARVCRNLDEMGCMVMLSNSCAGEVAGLFEGDPWKVRTVEAARFINSDGGNRTGHRELLITNYKAVPHGHDRDAPSTRPPGSGRVLQTTLPQYQSLETNV